MVTPADESLLLDISDAAQDMSVLVKRLKPLVAPKGTVIEAAKLKAAALTARKMIARSAGLAELYDDEVSPRTAARGDWASAAMEALVEFDDEVALALRALRLDPGRDAVRLVKAAKAAHAVTDKPTWATAKIRALEKTLPGADYGADKLFCGIDSGNLPAFPLLLLMAFLHKSLKARLSKLPNV